jgi:hypothetical protein
MRVVGSESFTGRGGEQASVTADKGGNYAQHTAGAPRAGQLNCIKSA